MPDNAVARARLTAPAASRLAQALSHPLRAQLLALLNERPASPNELARQVDERLENVAYHVRVLRDLGCIELVDTAQRRGAIEHYYRAIERSYLSDDEWAGMPAEVRQSLAGQWFEATAVDIMTALSAGTFTTRDDPHWSFTRVQLDEEAWTALHDKLQEVLDLAFELEAQSVSRSVESGRPLTPSRLAMAHYEGGRRGGS
ncbi:winged helix-turn-helix domain-containing protein [Capillimicrobium parvum]|uniref:HTH arsR-type domain-containing protein n=1 Tax=Capillimicrobium parvum TaxID=2884022 RepID=A0A9E6Y174_9ACTN|nr:winged helix-turn-helix domain-containing protein [Capillimicrobium parvum]UGS37778.1 hypothetical protein DSM104329_04199 [Capillimicrobium parvum]